MHTVPTTPSLRRPGRPSRQAPTALLAATALGTLVAWSGCSGQARQLPRPEPMAVHANSTLSDSEQKKLGDIRRFLGPREQALLERSIEDLANDPRVPDGTGDAALSRALGRMGGVSNFCDRFVEELASATLQGPEAAAAPDRVAFAVSTEEAYERWVTDATRARFASSLELGRAIRAGELDANAFDSAAPVGTPGRPLFVTDASVFEAKGASAAGILCLAGQPAPSYVVAVIPTAKLGSVRVPTAADGACRPRFELSAPDATAGATCTGRPEFVTATPTLGAVESFQISR